MPDLTDERRRALRLLAGSRRGCTTSIMMAHGFASEILAHLARCDLSATKAETVRVRVTSIEVVRVRITSAGRKAIAE
jgi:hypothetical protein